ncbi:unnamed protein product [Calicophoron daubneyi]|uniref:Uncharacterized protein n=1 Tax=Calicophoron daubneyi TaxID=300641 RepID=A0AAV2TDL6_CALDB
MVDFPFKFLYMFFSYTTPLPIYCSRTRLRSASTASRFISVFAVFVCSPLLKLVRITKSFYYSSFVFPPSPMCTVFATIPYFSANGARPPPFLKWTGANTETVT